MLKSLRYRLVLAISALQIATWLTILIVGGAHMWDELEEGYDAELAQFSLSVGALADTLDTSGLTSSDKQNAAQLPRTNNHGDVPHGVSAHNFHDHLVQVWQGDRVIFRSSTAPATLLNVPEGIHDTAIAGDTWKILRHTDTANGDRVIVGIRRHEVDSTIIATLLSVLVPLAGAGFVSTVLVFFLVSRLLRPLERWARKIGDLSPYDSDPIDDRLAFTEVRPVLAALNRMLERVRSSIAFERRFVRDAAHELRTPLTAIRAQIEAGDWKDLSAEQQSRMKKVHFGLARATRLVNQLMDLARTEEARSPARESRIEVGGLVRTKLTEFINASLILNPTRISLHATNDPLWLICNPNDLEIMLNNIVDNAVKYAGERARIVVTLARDAGHLRLIVEDDGPGIPAENRSDVFNRFVRLAPASSYGSGLGLSLVKEVAGKLGGQVVLGQSEQLNGLKVTVTLPIDEVANDDLTANRIAVAGVASKSPIRGAA